MTNVGNLGVALTGGPLDGDEIVLAAHGSTGPPQQLCYFTSIDEQPAWHVYESEDLAATAVWPEEDIRLRFHFVGTYAINKGRLST